MSNHLFEWLINELVKVQTFLRAAKPNQVKGGSEDYLRGLRDMCDWIVEKGQHEINYQGFRRLFSNSPEIPEHGSSFEIKPKRERRK